ncbi:MAG: hypothetical protein IJ370_00940 [Oscillospiraceae bacterium]|nr:hypothetical protein [Oscillospiraceae bacterium]
MKKIKFWILISCYLILAIADGALTYINTPDLSLEGNPLVANLGLGWTTLAVANVAVFILIFSASYYSYFKYKTAFNNETKFTAYCSQIVYDRADMFWKGLIPKHITPYIAGLGFSLLYSAIIARLIVVAEWLCITFNLTWSDPYFYFKDVYFFGRVDVFVAVIVAVIGMFYWFYVEFKKQLDFVKTK